MEDSTEADNQILSLAKQLERGETVDIEHAIKLLESLQINEHIELEPQTWDEYFETVPDQSWLWWPWIPRGEITMVAGEVDAGKSAFVITICDIIGRGKTQPDNTKPGAGGSNGWGKTEGRRQGNKHRT